MIIEEIIFISIICLFLKSRNWSIKDLNLKVNIEAILTSFAIVAALIVISGIFRLYFFKIFEDIKTVRGITLNHVTLQNEATWINIILIVLINSVYEEVLLLGYIFKRLKNYHPIIIIAISTILRLSFHTYQGIFIMFFILPMGIIFGYAYYKKKNLWPLILAHGWINLLHYVLSHL
ncbi:MAG: CPBP family intramembrane metalloprotease [bacterium]|nr:CPBP family intramembrane metalloprotease [bacterium]